LGVLRVRAHDAERYGIVASRSSLADAVAEAYAVEVALVDLRAANAWRQIDHRHVEKRYTSVTVELRMPSYYALAALIDGPLHGYAMVRRAAELSDGAVRLSTGTLYALLDRAIEEGLVVAGDSYVEAGRTRRDYALTAAGRDQLDAEARRLQHASRVVVTRLRATAALAAR
jgi:DNA-binding PadR family transcriptional regulator